MTIPDDTRDHWRRYLSAWIGFSAGGQFSQALSVAIVLYAFGINTVLALVKWPGSLAILSTLVVLAILSLVGARHRIEWHGLLPVSLIALFAYLGASVFWSQYTWVSIGGFCYSLAFGMLGMFLALSRDLVQVIRAMGDAFRILLAVSIGLEVLSGLLIDTPISFLGIQGNLAHGGPIQGIAGTRNFLGFLAAIGLVTFVVEWLMKSVTWPVALASSVGAAAVVFFASSPVTSIAIVVLVIATIALWILRRAPAERRPVVQGVLLVLVVTGLVLAYVSRARLIAAIGARSDLNTRLSLWGAMRPFIDLHSMIGWGYVGKWPNDIIPFEFLTVPGGRPSASGLGAFFDAWLQIGALGVILLLIAGTLAFLRAWTTASSHPIVAYVWPPLVLLLIAVTDTAESFVLDEGTLMVFVAIATVSARKRSWRSRLAPLPGRTGPTPTLPGARES
ncbi:hypothetical protein AX769_18015 [Frondihabitans sp. PAMC 28766]|uniref:hypothetical protein n=1 Tax=Frondihabitans sp. PAMC 28766 TaxID=1795630 RepID=UPI00078C1D3D|nr:hypothetical protein [Frondihabitans sp. PAMC 28766]AMM21696.1 hypothetical protein AX769_18015 [Frondihabitans sp. PAMC 28766]